MIKKIYTEGDLKVTEFPSGSVVKEYTNVLDVVMKEPTPSIEQQILAELQYNTALTEMKMVGGM